MVFLLSSQVYKATGEEFLKIAGGQISDVFFFLIPSSLLTVFLWKLVMKGFLLVC